MLPAKFNLPGDKMTTNRFIGLRATKKVKFLGEDVEIAKLSVAQVLKIQEMAKEFETTDDPMGNLKVLCQVVKFGARELSELSDEDMHSFPVDELTTLSEAVMQYSGLVQPVKK